MAKELSTEELLKLPHDEILKYIRKMKPAELLRKRNKHIPTPREYKAGGGMTRQGLSPAEEARSGTMSQAKRKRYMNKGGKVSYRNIGGVIGGGLNSQDVVDYLYKYKS